jgi:outer membrane protein assembly factor BamB
VHALTALILVVGTAVLLASAHLVWASGPTITITGYIAPTAPVTVNGSGYSTQDAAVNVYLDAMLLGTARVWPMGINGQTTGWFRFPMTVSGDTTPGPHLIKTVGQTSGSTMQVSILVHQNWFEFSFISSGGRFNPYENVISPSNVATLKPGWTIGGDFFYGHAAPVLVNGVLYVLSDSDGHFAAIDAATGTILWSFLAVNPTDTPIVADGDIFFGNSYGQFEAASAATGKPLWYYSLPVSSNQVRNPALLANGDVYFGDSGGNVFALSTGGALLWKSTLPEQDGWSGSSVAGGTLFVGTVGANHTGSLYALNVATGAVEWSAALGGVASVPVVANGMVYVGGENGEMAAFTAAGCGQSTCSPVWSYTTGAAILSSPAVANGVVYIGSEDHNLYAFNASGCGASTCAPLWKTVTGGMIDSSPAVANGVVYVGSDDYSLYALPAAECGTATCTPLWSYKTGYQVWSSPFVANGVVYLGGSDGILYTFVPSGSSQQSCLTHACRRPHAG